MLSSVFFFILLSHHCTWKRYTICVLSLFRPDSLLPVFFVCTTNQCGVPESRLCPACPWLCRRSVDPPQHARLHLFTGFHCFVTSANFSLFVFRLLRDLNRSDSDSSLSLSQVGDRLSAYSSKGHLIKPTSLMHGLSGRSEDSLSLHAHTPNGGNRVHESSPGEPGTDSPVLGKKMYSMEESPSLGEINSLSESSRSFSPNSTEPDTPSPTGGQLGAAGPKVNSRIPQLSSKKSPLEEDSGSTGEETDSTASRKKHTFKIFKKQRK